MQYFHISILSLDNSAFWKKLHKITGWAIFARSSVIIIVSIRLMDGVGEKAKQSSKIDSVYFKGKYNFYIHYAVKFRISIN